MIQLEAVRILLSATMLGYASWSDLRTREVSDLTWIVFGAPGLLMDVYEVAAGKVSPLNLAVPVLFSSALSFALGYLGLFGGADFKAFVALAVLQPYPPRLIRPVLGVVSVVYPLTVFSNSALAGASFGLVLLFRNMSAARRGSPLFEGHESEAPWRKLIILFSGVRVRLESVRGPPFQYPLEVPAEEGGRRLVLMPDIEDDEAAAEVFGRLRRDGVAEVWVSHTLPFLVFIALGYAVSLLVGDVAIWALGLILSQ